MLLRCFGLNDDPFGVTPEPRFLYDSNTHREALAGLKCGFYANRGFTALIAAPGLGKTTLLQCFLGHIRDAARSAYLFNVDGQYQPRDLVAAILRDLGIAPAQTPGDMHEQLNAALGEEARRGRLVVVVVDEAQNLSDAALESLRLLSNFETTRHKLMHIILAGQPQLSKRLQSPALVQLRQRIATVCRLDPLSPEETRAYINHRLAVAGHRGGNSLFNDQAVALIAGAGLGIPRTINTLCFNALLICRALNQKQVTASMVEEAVTDLQLPATPKLPFAVVPPARDEPPLLLVPDRESRESKRRTIAAAAATCAIILAIFGFAEIRSHQLRTIPVMASANSRTLPAASFASDVPKPVQATASANLHEPPSRQPETDAPKALSAPTPPPFKVKVALHHTLRDIAVQYLGEFNKKRLDEILALNPDLKDPDHVLAGQTILLPGPPPSKLSASAVHSK
jgi:type II secretory pathway predicted ATPase ExeA